jgi:tetratricopeptide (TPR) repeat protein
MKKIIALLILIVSSVAVSAQSTFKVVAPNVVSVDEQFNVTFTLSDSEKPSDFEWEASEDFQLVWGPQTGSSTSIQMINGKTTRSSQYTYTYILLPKKTGKFTLPAATVTVKKQKMTSNTVTIEVVSGGSRQSSPSASSGGQSQSATAGISDDDIFLKFSLNRTNVVVGEPIIATLKLYQRVNIAGFEDAKFPSFNGFWNQEIEAPTNIEFQRESLDDKIYHTALLRKYILIPQQSGTLTIEPAELVCLMNVRVSAGRTGSVFDGFFDDYRTIRKRVTSEAYKVNVSALPGGAPATFGGGVGNFTVTSKISKDSLKAHEAASLIVTVKGKGNVSLLEAPKVSFPPDFEVYDMKTKDNLDAGSGGTSGSRTFEYPFIPRSHGDFTLDPIKYTYYDVSARKYVTLETEPLELSVAKTADSELSASSSAPSVPSVNRKGVSNLNQDIRFINIKSSDLQAKGSFFVGSGLFNLLAAAIIILAAALWLALRKLAARRQDVVGAKTRRATKMAQKRLKSAEDYLKKNLYGAFYEELHKALLGYISDKLNISVADLSKEKISETLSALNVNSGLVESYLGLLDACEFARYSPSQGYEAMAKHFEDAVNVISSMDSNIKSVKKSGKTLSMIVISLLFVGGVNAQAAQTTYTDSLWTQAAAAYAEGNWQESIDGYLAISDLGLESAALYCNIGSAYFKQGNYPYAILYFERALKLDPSYSDARYNLEVASNLVQDKIDSVPEFILKAWTRDICYVLDSDAWAIIFLILLALTAAMVLLFLLGSRVGMRRLGFFSAIPTFLICLMALSFSMWQKKDYMTLDSAIITRPVVSVKSSPSAEASTDLFILHEGTKVGVIDDVGTWKNIELADGRQGWIKSSDMEVI